MTSLDLADPDLVDPPGAERQKQRADESAGGTQSDDDIAREMAQAAADA